MPASLPPFSDAPDRQARHWLVRLTSGNLGEEEMRQFQAWAAADPAHRVAFEQQRRLWKALDQVETTLRAPPSGQAELPPLSATGLRARQRRPVRRRLLVATGIAALLLLALAVPQLRLMVQADHRTTTVPASFTLDDGSEVWLDADTAIAVNYDTGQRRIDLLRGNAWFNVAHAETSAPFIVTALGGQTRDIGTAFLVTRSADRIHTAVSQGQVEIGVAESRLALHAGQQAGYRSDGTLEPLRRIAIDDIAPWRHGQLLFDQTPASEAIARIARYRKGKVWLFGNVDPGETVTAVFRTDRPDEALDILAKRLNLKQNRLPGGILILRARSSSRQ